MSEYTTRLVYRVDLAEALRRGVPAPADGVVTIDLDDPAQIPPETRARIAAALDRDGVTVQARGRSGGYGGTLTAPTPDLAGLVEAIAAEDAAVAQHRADTAAREADQARAVAQREAEDRAKLAAWEAAVAALALTDDGLIPERPEGQPLFGWLQGQDTWTRRLSELRREWAQKYGSAVLRDAIAMGVAHDDRLDAEYAEFVAGSRRAARDASYSYWLIVERQPDDFGSHPKRQDLAILRAARAVAPAAVLGRVNGTPVAWIRFRGQYLVWPPVVAGE